ncbi:MAG: FUSC family protein [Bryobacteraceae bacterium]
MAGAATQFAARFNREWLAHTIRTTFAAVMSLYIARLAGLPEAYWATITTLIVMQSTLGAALTPSRQRFVGIALGAAAGALTATYFGASTIVYTLGIFVLGLVCALLRMDRSAYRFAGAALAIVVLASHENAAWVAALHRFAKCR